MEYIEVFAKDDIRLNILSALLDGSAGMTLFLESEGADVPFAALRPEGGAARRYSNFSVRENPSEDSVTFHPVVVGCPAVIAVTIRSPLAGDPRLTVVRNGSPAHSLAMSVGMNRFSLSPIDMKRYVMRPETAAHEVVSSVPPPPTTGGRRENLVLENAALEGDCILLEREIAALEARKTVLAEKKRLLRQQLEWLSANVEGEESKEVEELRATLGVDEEILRCYMEQDVPGIEDLIAEIRTDIGKLEEQIRIFVRRKEEKTLEIEKNLRNAGR
jgi:hypothetical protein